MDAGARAAPASGALARGALLLLFGLLRRAAAPHTDGLGDGLAVVVHVADLNRVARLEIGGADILAPLLDLGLEGRERCQRRPSQAGRLGSGPHIGRGPVSTPRPLQT